MANFFKRIRQFFWLSTGLGILSIFTNLTPSSINSTDVGGANKVSMVGKAIQEGAEYVADNEPGGRLSEEPVYSSSGKSMLWKGKRYVLIRNKWVAERGDNIYMVDGQRTLFKDTAKVVTKKDLEASGENTLGGSGTSSKKAQDLLQKVISNPLQAYSPTTMKEMAEALSAAKATILDHNKQLDDLSK